MRKLSTPSDDTGEGACTSSTTGKHSETSTPSVREALCATEKASTTATAIRPGGLPPGWVLDPDVPKSKGASQPTKKARAKHMSVARSSTLHYLGPSGERVSSVVQAWRLHNGLAAWDGCDSSDEEDCMGVTADNMPSQQLLSTRSSADAVIAASDGNAIASGDNSQVESKARSGIFAQRDLPPGWRKEVRSSAKRSYAVYFGPAGERAQSIVAAWANHLGESHVRVPKQGIRPLQEMDEKPLLVPGDGVCSCVGATSSRWLEGALKAAAEKALPPERIEGAGHGAYVYAYGALPSIENAEWLASTMLKLLMTPSCENKSTSAAGRSNVAQSEPISACSKGQPEQSSCAEGVQIQPEPGKTDSLIQEPSSAVDSMVQTRAGVGSEMLKEQVGIDGVVHTGVCPPILRTPDVASSAGLCAYHPSLCDRYARTLSSDGDVNQQETAPEGADHDPHLNSTSVRATTHEAMVSCATSGLGSLGSLDELGRRRTNRRRHQRVSLPSIDTPDAALGLPSRLGAAATRASPVLMQESTDEPPPPRDLHVLLLCHSLVPEDATARLLDQLVHPASTSQAEGGHVPNMDSGGEACTGPIRRGSGRKRQLSLKARESADTGERCPPIMGGCVGRKRGVHRSTSMGVSPGKNAQDCGQGAAKSSDATLAEHEAPHEALVSIAAGINALRHSLAHLQATNLNLAPLSIRLGRENPANDAIAHGNDQFATHSTPCRDSTAAVAAATPAAEEGAMPDSRGHSTLVPVAVPMFGVRVLSVDRLCYGERGDAYEMLNVAADVIHSSIRAGAAVLVCSAPSAPLLKQLAKMERSANKTEVVSDERSMSMKAAQPSADMLGHDSKRVESSHCDRRSSTTDAEMGRPAKPTPAVQLDCWARACVAAYSVRWRGTPAVEAASAAQVAKAGGARSLLRGYFPALFSVSLFELERSTQFGYYASSTVAFIKGKCAQFGGCEFELHMNAAAASHDGLLRACHEAARGRITFREYSFVPRPKVAPWLLAAMRLASLLEHDDGMGGGRTVVTMDVHDDPELQDGQLRALHAQLHRERKEMCITWWLAEDGAGDCLVGAPLPVPRLKACIPDTAYHSNGTDGGLGLHAHMDAGMMIAQGSSLRRALRSAHPDLSFKEFLRQYVMNAPSIPHGIEEMAWDSYFVTAGWENLLPLVLFSVHRSLIAGRDTTNPFSDIAKDNAGIPIPSVVTSSVSASLVYTREEFDIGRSVFGNSLACCRHSQVLDCAADSEFTRAAGGKAVGQRVYVRRRGASTIHVGDREGNIEMCAVCGQDEVSPESNALLLCDGIDTTGAPCPKTYHQFCCTPPIKTVPEGDWFCPDCCRRRTG